MRKLLHKPAFIIAVLLGISVFSIIATLLFVFLWIIISRSPATTSKRSLGRSAAVIVLGDVGRSPRMCLHAQSLAEDGWRVALIGYKGTLTPKALQRSSVKHYNVVQPFAKLINILPRSGGLFALITAPLKFFGQSAALFWILATQVKPPPELMIVQTPPALPTLFVVRLVGLLLGSRTIIDWHNLGYSILALRFKSNSPIVWLYAELEKRFGRKAFTHICVTNSLKLFLKDKWKVQGEVKVLYDRPPKHYRKARIEETHQLFTRLLPSLEPSIDDWSGSSFTKINGSQVEFNTNRPAIVISSTSWTEDEDFGMLLRAASMYEKRAKELAENNFKPKSNSIQAYSDSPAMLDSPMTNWGWQQGSRDKSRRASFSPDNLPRAQKLPKMLLIVTGKGELKQNYIEKIAQLERTENWQYVRIRTAWLASEDYPLLLGSADIGVSLHSSSSGMDLPMKVVDMLGCGLSVCALGFPCIGELIQHGQNGLVFYNERELALQLESLLSNYPESNWLTNNMQNFTSLFPEDIPKSPPGSSSATPIIGSSPSSTPMIDQRRSSSPLPMFTLLHSPAQEVYQFDNIASRDWSNNWKRIIRPLILQADLEDDAKRGKVKISTTQEKHTTPKSSMEINRSTKTTPPENKSKTSAISPKELRHRRANAGIMSDPIETNGLFGSSEDAFSSSPKTISFDDQPVRQRQTSIPGIQISAPPPSSF